MGKAVVRKRKNPVAKQVVRLKPQTHKDRKKETKKQGPIEHEYHYAHGGRD